MYHMLPLFIVFPFNCAKNLSLRDLFPVAKHKWVCYHPIISAFYTDNLPPRHIKHLPKYDWKRCRYWSAHQKDVASAKRPPYAQSSPGHVLGQIFGKWKQGPCDANEGAPTTRDEREVGYLSRKLERAPLFQGGKRGGKRRENALINATINHILERESDGADTQQLTIRERESE